MTSILLLEISTIASFRLSPPRRTMFPWIFFLQLKPTHTGSPVFNAASNVTTNRSTSFIISKINKSEPAFAKIEACSLILSFNWERLGFLPVKLQYDIPPPTNTSFAPESERASNANRTPSEFNFLKLWAWSASSSVCLQVAKVLLIISFAPKLIYSEWISFKIFGWDNAPPPFHAFFSWGTPLLSSSVAVAPSISMQLPFLILLIALMYLSKIISSKLNIITY